MFDRFDHCLYLHLQRLHVSPPHPDSWLDLVFIKYVVTHHADSCGTFRPGDGSQLEGVCALRLHSPPGAWAEPQPSKGLG